MDHVSGSLPRPFLGEGLLALERLVLVPLLSKQNHVIVLLAVVTIFVRFLATRLLLRTQLLLIVSH